MIDLPRAQTDLIQSLTSDGRRDTQITRVAPPIELGYKLLKKLRNTLGRGLFQSSTRIALKGRNSPYTTESRAVSHG